MKALIIDDEKKARNVLQILLQENCPQITDIFTAENLLDGIAIIRKEQPQLVFLDIEMPEHSGLEIGNFINPAETNFEIIFVTAYSEYAVQAFQLSAIDYLLKPVRPAQIKEAVDKAISKIGQSQISQRLEELKKSLTSFNFSKIGLTHKDGVKFVNFEQISSLSADGVYCKVYLNNGDSFLISKPLGYYADLLQKNSGIFFRPHRSHLINLMYLQEYNKQDGGSIVMENGIRIPVSRGKKEEFLAIIDMM